MFGLIILWLVTYFLMRQKLSLTSEKHLSALEEIKQLSTSNESLQEEIKNLDTQVDQLNIQLIASQKDLDFLNQKLEDHQNNEQLLTQKFEHLANKIFEEKGKTITDQNKNQLENLLNPLKEKIRHFEKKVEDNNKEQIDRHSSLREQLFQLRELNREISKEAQNLTKALKGETKTQGNWGELILESVLEKSGLEKDREYTVQQSFVNSEGKRLQPDVVIHLPDNKKMVIDSKVSLIAYEQFVNEADELLSQQYLQDHIRSIKNHVNSLSEKNYHDSYQIESPDFVLLFIPIETAFSVAVQQDHRIYQDAFDKNIVIVTPSTLLATLKTIESLWQNEKQHRNSLEIATEAGRMYDKFVNFVGDMEQIGTRIQQSGAAYESAFKKLQSGSGNLIGKAAKLKELGAKANKNLGNQYLSGEE